MGGTGGGGIPGARAAAVGAELVAPEFGARKSLSGCRLASGSSPAAGFVSRRGHPGEEGEKMVVLRSSLELHSHPAASATDSLDLSSEFLSLEQIGRRRLRSAGAAEQSAVTVAAAGVSTGLERAPRGRTWGLPAALCPVGPRMVGWVGGRSG